VCILGIVAINMIKSLECGCNFFEKYFLLNMIGAFVSTGKQNTRHFAVLLSCYFFLIGFECKLRPVS